MVRVVNKLANELVKLWISPAERGALLVNPILGYQLHGR